MNIYGTTLFIVTALFTIFFFICTSAMIKDCIERTKFNMGDFVTLMFFMGLEVFLLGNNWDWCY